MSALFYPLAEPGTRYEETEIPETMMSPATFLARVRPLDVDDASRDAIDDLKNHIMAGRKLDPLHIRADGKEDGRRRAHAAMELGIALVPVVDEQPAAQATLRTTAIAIAAPAVPDPTGDWFQDASPAQQAILRQLNRIQNFHDLDTRANRESLLQCGQASFNDFEVVPGTYKILFSDMGELDGYNNAKDRARIEALAAAIKESGEIEPVFIALDQEGFWLVEGQHRSRALRLLGYDGIPARVMVDLDDVPELTMTLTPAIETPSDFATWFADSKVVNAEGAPLVVYHGTRSAIDAFTVESQGRTFEDVDVDVPREGFWFTDAPDNALWYAHKAKGDAGPNIIPVVLNLRNPFVYGVQAHSDEGLSGLPSQHDLEALGHDGIVVQVAEDEAENPAAEAMWALHTPVHGAPVNWPEPLRNAYSALLDVPPAVKHTHYVAFHPEQIRTAVGLDLAIATDVNKVAQANLAFDFLQTTRPPKKALVSHA